LARLLTTPDQWGVETDADLHLHFGAAGRREEEIAVGGAGESGGAPDDRFEQVGYVQAREHAEGRLVERGQVLVLAAQLLLLDLQAQGDAVEGPDDLRQFIAVVERDL